MKFEFYVINYNFNKRTTEMYNIFNNIYVQEECEKEIKKYLRSSKKYGDWNSFVDKIDRIIKWQEWGRCEYEISANEKFVIEISDIVKDVRNMNTVDEIKEYLDKQNKIYPRSKSFDCYEQAHANIECICYEIIRQYKQQLKEKNHE